MRRPFSHAFVPPAPVVPVRLRSPSGQPSVVLDGKIDTGADLCGIPDQLVGDLDLPPVRSVRASGFAGAPHEVVVYRVDVEIEGWLFRRVEAVAVHRPYVLVGRNRPPAISCSSTSVPSTRRAGCSARTISSCRSSLGPDAIRALLRDQLGEDPSVAALPEIIHDRTKGNPFFIEEVVQSLVESGHLAGARGA